MANSIVQIYSKATYLPFLKYCQERHYQTMEDLARCPFHLLGKEPGFTPLLASRVKAVYDSYCKTQGIAQPVRQSAEPAGRAFTEPELVKWLYAYFQKNQEKLVTVSELVKELNGRAGRAAVVKVLQNVSWCSAVDKTTFFYSAKQEES